MRPVPATIFLAGCLLSSQLVHAATREYRWDVAYKTISPVGVPKQMNLVNGQYPGPTVRASVGDRVRIIVNNSLPDNGTTIHWHGVNQVGSPWSDGVPAVNQCPIPSNGSYTYEFIADEAGSTFWHSHYGPQYPNGLIGPIVIDDPNETYKYDDEYIVVLTDYYQNSTWTLSAIDRTPIESATDIPHRPPPPDAVLICGPSGSCNTKTRQSFAFQSGKTYRLRIINMSNFAGYHFSIDNHPLKLIGSDFNALNGQTTDIIPIWPGQRYDVLVDALPNYTENVWMRSVTQNACYPIQNPNLDPVALAVVAYTDPSVVPTSQPYPDDPSTVATCLDLDPSKLTPLVPRAAVAEPDQTLFLNVWLGIDYTVHIINGLVNGSSFASALFGDSPTLFDVHDGVNPTSFSPDRNAYVLPKNGTVRVVLNTTLGPGAHPYHMHGHTFQVLGMLNGSYNGNEGLNLVNPPRRDTFLAPANATAVFQFETDNPGVQFFHCHMDWHLIEGLAAQFIELPDAIKQLSIPQAARDLCAAN